MNSEHAEVLERLRERCAALDAAIAALSAPQPHAEAQPCGCGEATCTVPWEPGCGLGKSEQHAACVGCEGKPSSENTPCAVCGQQPASDGGFTAADMMDARQEGRKEAQKPAAVGVEEVRET